MTCVANAPIACRSDASELRIARCKDDALKVRLKFAANSFSNRILFRISHWPMA